MGLEAYNLVWWSKPESHAGLCWGSFKVQGLAALSKYSLTNFSKVAISSLPAWLTPDTAELGMLASGMLLEVAWLNLRDMDLFVNLQQFRKRLQDTEFHSVCSLYVCTLNWTFEFLRTFRSFKKEFLIFLLITGASQTTIIGLMKQGNRSLTNPR